MARKSYRKESTKAPTERTTAQRLSERAKQSGRKTEIAPEAQLKLGYNPVPLTARDLAVLRGGVKTEVPATGIRTERGGVLKEEWSSEKPLTRERLLEVLERRIREMEEEHKSRGEKVTDQERNVLEYLRLAQTEIKGGKEVPPTLKDTLSKGFGRGAEIAGTAVGIGIVITAVLGWYIRYRSEQGIPAKPVPPIPSFG